MTRVSRGGSPVDTGGPPGAQRHTFFAVTCLAAATFALGTGTWMTIASTRSPAPVDPASVDKGEIGTDLSALLPGLRLSPTAAAHDPGHTPVAIRIPSIGVDASVVGLRLDREHRLPPPSDFATVGWWREASAPGESGTAVLVGHIDSTRGPAVFARLRSLEPGARVDVRRSDGTVAVFVVDGIREFPKSTFPTRWVYGPTAKPTLRLITCGGVFDRRTGHYLDNVVVFAHLVTVSVPK